MPDKATKSELKKNKDMASKLLSAQGKDYDEWLNEAHQKVIAESTQTMEEALNLLISSQKNKSNEKNEVG